MRITSARDSIFVLSEVYNDEHDWWTQGPRPYDGVNDFEDHPDFDEAVRLGWTPHKATNNWQFFMRPQGSEHSEIIVPSLFGLWDHYSHGEGSVYQKTSPSLLQALERGESYPGREHKLSETDDVHEGTWDPPKSTAQSAREWLEGLHRSYGQ